MFFKCYNSTHIYINGSMEYGQGRIFDILKGGEAHINIV